MAAEQVAERYGPDPACDDDDNKAGQARAEEVDLSVLAGAHAEQLYAVVDTAQLRIQLVLLSLVKALVYSLLLVLLAVTAWLLLLAVLLSALVHMGVPLSASLGAGCAMTFLGAWLSWRLLVRSIRSLRRAAPAGVGAAGGGGEQ